LTFTLEHQLEMLVFYHLQGHESGIEFLQATEEDDFARKHIAPKEGIKKSAFYEAISERGLQLQEIFHSLYAQAKNIVPKKYAKLAELVAVDGSLVDATLSMYWAEYREGSNKFKAHVGFNVNQGISQKFHLTEGKGGERPFVGKIVNPGRTAILDRGYQNHSGFSISGMRTAVTSFAGSRNIQLKNSSPWSVLKLIQTRPPRLSESDGGQALMVQFCLVRVISPIGRGDSKTQEPLRMVGYRVGGITYHVVTDRMDLTAEEIAIVYKLRWEIEKFFVWWKKRLNVYHLISRSTYGVIVQIFAGIITYLLMAIYCAEKHGEWVNMKWVRELRNTIQNELCSSQMETTNFNKQKRKQLHART